MNLEVIYSKIGGRGGGGQGELITGCYSAPLKKKQKKKTAATFDSQGDAHVRTDAQIKFLYYPLTV